MASQIGSLYYKIFGDTSKLNSSLKKSDDAVKKTGGSFSKFGKLLKGAAVAGAAVFAAKKIGQLGLASIKAGSDAEETRNKFDVVFRDVASAAEESARVLDEQYGLSGTAALDLLANTGDLLAGFGFTQDAALDLSTQVNQLAVDLGSFQNVDTQTASEALTKALLGERESVKQLGISILDADVKAKVLQLTQEGMTFDTERQAKAYATLQLAIAQSGNAIGDYARSQESFANQSKEARAAVDDLKVSIGERLLPVATESVSMFAGLTQKLADFIAERNNLKAAEDAEKKTLAQRILLAKEELKIAEEALNVEQRTLNSMSGTTDSIATLLERDAGVIRERSAEVQEATDALFKLRLEKQSGIALNEEVLAAEKKTAEAEKEIADEKAEREESAMAAEEERLAAEKEAAEERARIKEEETEAKIDSERMYADAINERNLRIIESEAALVAAEEMLNQQKLESYNSFTNGFVALLGLAAGESREAAIASKALSSAQAGIASYLAFTNTLATGGPFPVNVINAGGVLAAGIAQQVKILSTPIPGFATGGIVPGTSFSGDNVPANVNSGEMVLTKDQQTQLFNMANGAGGGAQTIILQLPNGREFARWTVDSINNGQGGTISARVVK